MANRANFPKRREQRQIEAAARREARAARGDRGQLDRLRSRGHRAERETRRLEERLKREG